MPVSVGKCFSNCVKASSPPADAPMPTIGKAGRDFWAVAQWPGTFQPAADAIFPTPPIFASAMFSYLAILFQASSFIYPWSAPTFFSLHSTVSKGSFWDGGTLVRRVDILGSLVMLQ